MKTEFKDVAHLYYGCDIVFNNDDEKKIFELDGKTLSVSSEVKPILRKLVDMSDSEAAEAARLATHRHEKETWKVIKIDRSNSMVRVYFTDAWAFDTTKDYFVKVAPYPSQGAFTSYKGEILKQDHYQFPLDAYLYLIKQGFDLFDLIESGQAIDKTKL